MFKVGDRVKVIKRVGSWSYGGISTAWDSTMDKSIGKVYTIVDIAIEEYIEACSGYRLNTAGTQDGRKDGWNAFYPEESLEHYPKLGQLQFSFMKEK